MRSDDRRPSVLHVVHNDCVGGSALQVLRIAQRQVALGQRVAIVTRASPSWRRARGAFAVPVRFLPLRGNFDLASALAIARIVRREAFEVLHAHKGLDLSLCLLASLLVPVPAVVVHRTVAFPLGRWNGWKYRLRRVARVIAVSEAVRRVVVASAGVDPAKVVVVRRGVDLERREPHRAPSLGLRRELGLAPGDRVVGMVASVVRHKGHDVLVRAAPTILERVPEALFLCVGEPIDPGLAREVQRRAREAGVAGRFRLLGFRTDVFELIRLFEVGVLPSRSEGFPNALPEQMALGRPVVAAAVGGVPDIVDPGRTGLFVPPEAPDALARAVVELLSNRDRALAMGRRAREHVRRHLSMQRQVEELLAIYREVVARAAVERHPCSERSPS